MVSTNPSSAKTNKASFSHTGKAWMVFLGLVAFIMVQVGGNNSTINKTMLPTLYLSIEEALEYLQQAQIKHLEEGYEIHKNSTTSHNFNFTVGQYGRDIANSFLNFFFEELEAQGGLEQDGNETNVETTKRKLLKETAARFI